VVPINKLKLTKLQFIISFTQNTYLPKFIGNTIRGALGQVLYLHYPQVFSYVFKAKNAESIPNPIAISVPYPSKMRYAQGETLSFNITLLGTACAFEQDIINAAKLMCNGKLANAKIIDHQQIYSLDWSDEGVEHIPICNHLSINFITPTEILSSGKPSNTLDFATFIDRAFLRISRVIDSYGESEFTIPYRLIDRKPHVKTECKLKPVNFHTNKQPIFGVLGQVSFTGNVTRYLPYIDLVSQIHIGKKTSRGCGQYTFEI